MTVRAYATALLMAAGLAAAPSAQAGPISFGVATSPATCAPDNCGSAQISGAVLLYGTRLVVPWEQQIYASAGECLRLDVIFQVEDLQVVAVAPNGRVYRNDNRTAPDRRPLVKINSSAPSGWYTVQISQTRGVAPVDTNFVLAFGRYAGGNANCGSPTPPL